MTNDLGTIEPAHCAATDGCITCGDIAVPLTVVELRGVDVVCRDGDGRTETVAIDFVTDVGLGDELLVHAGVALERLQSTDTDR